MSDPVNTEPNDNSAMMSKLEQITTQLSQLQQKLDRIDNLPEQVERLEEKLLRVSNIYRYERLQTLLKEGKWLEADKETSRLILAIAGETDIERLRPDEIENISCSELQVIDRLWLTYSDNRFGFSVQAKIYQELGGSIETTIEQNADITERWGDRLKWRESKFWGQFYVGRYGGVKINPTGSLTFTGGSGPRPHQAIATVAANEAVRTLVEALAKELAPVRVNAISPYYVNTPMWSGMKDKERQELFNNVSQQLPIGRVAEIEDIAPAYLDIIYSTYITGTNIPINGGALLQTIE